MGLLALAIAPGLAICLFIYLKDKYNKEPIKWLLLCFLLGMLSTIPALIIQVFAAKPVDRLFGEGLLQVGFSAFFVVALSEELSKFMVVRYFAFNKPHFDDPFDGIVYSVMVSMGFATLENIGYVMQHGLATGILRMFLSVPAHATFGVLMGYFVGMAKYNPAKRGYYLMLALLWPVTFHGLFDFFLFAGKTYLHFAGAIVSFLVAIKLSRRAIRKKQEMSRAYWQQDDTSASTDPSLFNKK